MFELLHVFMWLFNRRVRKEAEEEGRRREWCLHPLRYGPESAFEPAYQEHVMGAVKVVVREHVSEPETAEVTDYTFYGPTDCGVAVWVEMESTNVVGDRARNHFVVHITDIGLIDACIAFDYDPRTLREENAGADGGG